MYLLQGSVTERSGKRLWLGDSSVKVVVVERVGQMLLGHDESEPVWGLTLFVGPRWREFHCLPAPRLSLGIGCGL